MAHNIHGCWEGLVTWWDDQLSTVLPMYTGHVGGGLNRYTREGTEVTARQMPDSIG